MDVMKTRMQILGQTGETMSTGALANSIVKKEGIPGLYSGLSAAILRQITYTTTRLGLYGTIRDVITPVDRPATVVHRVGAAVAAGAAAACVCNPVEVCLVRMQADGRLPPAEQRGYKHVGDALMRVAREEGVLTYWRGCTPTVVRAIVVSVTQVAGYDQIKAGFLSTGYFQDNIFCHLTSSVAAGFIYSLASLPFDTTKTRMQNQKPGPDGKLPYTGTFQTMTNIIRNEGAASMWKGFMPYFGRCGGHTVMMFIFVEQYKKLAQYMYQK
uniref:Uncharacterized protein n=1 Tax=Eutreptiella gymnastica TaxID=73025 RepID=A0A7S4GIE6_9EUGL